MKPGLFGQLDGANPHLAVLCDISGSHNSDAADSSLPGFLRRVQRQSSTDASNGRTAFIFRATETEEATDLVPSPSEMLEAHMCDVICV
jgi:hypothetical protein